MKKYIVLSAMITTLSATSVMAQTNPVAVITPIMTDTSTAAVFAEPKVENIQAMELSSHEMKDTQGAWIQLVGLAGVGGFYGGLTYANAVPTLERTWQGWTMSIGSGMVGGAIGGLPLGGVRMAFMGGTVAYVGGSWGTSNWGRRSLF